MQNRSHCARLVATLAFIAAGLGCSRTELADFGPASTRVDVQSPEVGPNDDVSGGPISVDAGSDAASPDAEPADTGDRPAPEIATPERSDAVDELYCELSNGQLVQGALRGAACLDLSLAGFFDEASRGFVFGEVLLGSYAQSAYADCEFFRCLSNAVDCAEAEACQDERLGGECDGFESRCDGDALESCVWNGEFYEWTTVQHCERAGASCNEEEVCDRGGCRTVAGCGERERDQECLFQETCEGDTMVRCLPVAGEGVGARVEIACDELIENGTCVQTPIGGEFPGPACSVPEQACVNSFAEGFACNGEGALTLCLFGDIIEIQCDDYGYSACEDQGFFGVRCVN